ncbi:putative quinol monooxygenase [Sinomonas halotolerans]|uniref:Quinol monooxygenase n=1 Tax=Sinomonas halotolerans TaxID=1644133 RepID=A0ABU9WXM7_9MICC
MYFIVVKFETLPEYTEAFPQIVREFTESTRAEPGNLFFEWSRSLENPAEYVLVEAFTDEGAGPHVQSEHFAAGLEAMRPCLARTPSIVSRQVDGSGWDAMGELQVG